MKICHVGDLHVCQKHQLWTIRALANAIDTAIAQQCDLAVIAGDSFDAAIHAHEPAFVEFVEEIVRLADAMPIVLIYGTQSHDRPGSLDVLRTIPTQHMIDVVAHPTQLDIAGCRVSALPGLNKADPGIMAQGANAWAREVMASFASGNVRARADGMPSIFVTHGTVTGCTTESGYAMVSPDHEFDLEALASADADAVMLGHIHRHQAWHGVRTPSGATTEIAYSGSLARLVHGHLDPVGFLIWDLEPGKPASFAFHASPSRQLVEISFAGPPDIDELRAMAATVGPEDAVRIRWEIDEEHAAGVDRALIRELFAGAETLKLEPRVLPIQRVRAAGIGRAMTLADKLEYWCDTTGSQEALTRLRERLGMIQLDDPEHIAAQIVGASTPVQMMEAA